MTMPARGTRPTRTRARSRQLPVRRAQRAQRRWATAARERAAAPESARGRAQRARRRWATAAWGRAAAPEPPRGRARPARRPALVMAEPERKLPAQALV